jgi:RNA polymerase sigma-70 factor (ECF subfamily)
MTTSVHIDDARLVAQAKRGDEDAFAELYRRYADSIYRYALSRGQPPADAEDVVSTVFLRAYQSLPGYRERGWPFSAFLYRIARNTLVDLYRRDRREVSDDGAQDRSETEPEGEVDDQIARRAQLDAVRQALADLPEDYQEVIRLRLLLELPTATVAAWMGRREGAARVLLHRALRALRERMVQDDGSV